MKIFSEELVEKAVKELHIANLAQATIGDVLLVAQYLEKETGIPFIRMDQGSPGLAANQIGIEAEKAALDMETPGDEACQNARTDPRGKLWGDCAGDECLGGQQSAACIF